MRLAGCGLVQGDWQGRRGSQRLLRAVLGREGFAVAVASGYVSDSGNRSSSWV